MNLTDTLALFGASLAISLPIFGWVMLGVLLNRFGWLPQWLIDRVSRLAFNIFLPIILFTSAATVDYTHLGGAHYLYAGILSTLVVTLMSWYYSLWRGHLQEHRGIFVQAAFRSNLAIVGLALAISAYGDRGPQLAALPVALMTALYNVLAVGVLNSTLGASNSVAGIALGILRNPLIVGIAAGVVFSLSGLPMPELMEPVNRGLSTFFLPMMLMCIGGSMRLSGLGRTGMIAWESTAWRLCVSPALTVLLALALGVQGETLGVLFLLVSTPAAASGFVMVVAARGDGVLAANIVVLTTLMSMVTVTIGFFLLSLFGLVGRLA